MKLIDQRTKKIMEECKTKARDVGLSFQDETLEYIVTNRDMLDLSPKVMIPTLYDYWVHDVEVLKEYGKYKLYPSNPYETVINSRPAISFYNDNNPDWMNVMIFYHVLGHIDFFQNNILFEHTWNDDFVGQALADKRLIESLRSEHGRWVDYVIEFSRSIDNITGFYESIASYNYNESKEPSPKIAFYFDYFLQEQKKLAQHQFFAEIMRYNNLLVKNKELAESVFFAEVKLKYPEFEAFYIKFIDSKKKTYTDVLEFIRENSTFLKKDKNSWMQLVMTIIRNTSIYFAPQIRTKIINEGWASYWHDELFRSDERIKEHEIAFAKLNAGVTALTRVGLNPYAIGVRLIAYVEELANKGKLNYHFQQLRNIESREEYNQNINLGREAIFSLRKIFSDFSLINTFVDQDFVDMHDLFVVGQRFNPERQTIEYYIKSRKAADYKKMLLDSLYHPPKIIVDYDKTNENNLYLIHKFENKQLIKDFIQDTMMSIEFLWGAQVQLETTEIIPVSQVAPDSEPKFDYRRVLYTMKEKRISQKLI